MMALLVCALTLMLMPSPAAAQGKAPEFLDQTWHLNPEASFLSIHSVKKGEILETHRFSNLAGTVEPNGKATIKIDLASIATGVDLRDVRMRFLLFETFKFPIAEISATIKRSDMRRLATEKRLIHPLTFELDLHGVKKEMKSTVVISRAYDNAVSVSSSEPLIVHAKDFGLSEGVGKLAAAVGNIDITPAAFVSFNVLFEGERFNPDVRNVVAVAAKRAAETKASNIKDESCRSRFAVFTETRGIYFRSGRAALDQRSTPILATVAETLKRCPNVIVEAGGHTDNVGAAASNLQLSRARADAVVDNLIARGVAKSQLRAAGYGDTKPVASNTTRANRARNRRIEFRVVGRLAGQ